jgi:hypothetical protein
VKNSTSPKSVDLGGAAEPRHPNQPELKGNLEVGKTYKWKNGA